MFNCGHSSGLLFLHLCLCPYLSIIWPPSPHINLMYSILRLQFEYHIRLTPPTSRALTALLWLACSYLMTSLYTPTSNQPWNTGPAYRQRHTIYGEAKSHLLLTPDFLRVTSGVKPILTYKQTMISTLTTCYSWTLLQLYQLLGHQVHLHPLHPLHKTQS